MSGAALAAVLVAAIGGAGGLIAWLIGRVKKRWARSLALVTEHPDMTLVADASWSKHAARGSIEGIPLFVFGDSQGNNIELTIQARLDLPKDLVIGRQSVMSRLRRAGGPEVTIGSDALDRRFELRGSTANIAAFFNDRVREAFERAWVVAQDVSLRDGNITVRRMGLDMKPEKVMVLVGAVVEAAIELRRLGGMSRPERLAETSRDADPVVARMAAAALFEHEPDTPQAASAYTRGLRAKDPWMRMTALTYSQAGPEVFRCAVKLLEDGAAPNGCRAEAAWHVVEHVKRYGLEAPGVWAVLGALRGLLKTANGSLLAAAVMTLEDAGAPPDAATLAVVLERANREARSLLRPYVERLEDATGPRTSGSLALTEEETDGGLAIAAEAGGLEVAAHGFDG